MLDLIETFHDTLGPVFDLLGVSPDERTKGLGILKHEAGRLAFEIGSAETNGIGLAAAVNDPENFPITHKLHLGIRDLLTLQLPPELVPLARRILRMGEPPNAEDLRRELARIAGSPSAGVPERAFARLILFESVRFSMMILTWKDGHEFARVGMDDEELDQIVEKQVRTLVDDASVLDGEDPIRPLPVLVCATLHGALERLTEASHALQSLASELRSRYQLRGDLDELLRGMDARDAVVIKNFYAPVVWQEQRLTVERLMKYHPLLFEGERRDAVDARLHRRITALERKGLDGAPRRKTPAFIDLVFELLAEGSR